MDAAAGPSRWVISDRWDGLDALLEPNHEIILAHTSRDVLHALHQLDENTREAMGARARRRILEHHTAAHRAETLERELECAMRRVGRGASATLPFQ
nr:glycosyltransferase [Azospirillum brasilense]